MKFHSEASSGTTLSYYQPSHTYSIEVGNPAVNSPVPSQHEDIITCTDQKITDKHVKLLNLD